MKRNLLIEWQHVGADVTNTCERCSATGTTLHRVLQDLAPCFIRKNIRLDFKETVLAPAQLPDSNRILINGKAFEDYLASSRIVQTPCCSCECIVGKESVECRAIETPEGLYESIPSDLMRRIIMAVTDEIAQTPDSSGNRCCK